MARVMVTGGAGFIGSHLVSALLERGDEIRIVDNFLTGQRANIERLGGAVELRAIDLRDEAALIEAARGIELIFHQAAIPSVPRSIAEPKLTYDVNVRGTQNLLEAAYRAEVEVVVMASSSSIYGDLAVSPKHEGLMPDPLSPYAAQKLATEQLGQAFARCFGMKVVSLRYFNVFGPRQDPLSPYAAVIPRFVTRLLANEPPIIYGDGEQTRDFTFIDNVVAANIAASGYRGSDGLVANIADGKATSVNQLARLIADLLGKSAIQPRHEPPREGDVRDSLASVERAREAFGYEPVVGLEVGLKKTVGWYSEQAEEA